jgi:hypothetical protein
MRSMPTGVWLGAATADEPRPGRADLRGPLVAAGPLLAASWLAVRRAPLLAPALAAVVLVAVSWPWQDSGRAIDVLNGLAVLLACAWAGTTDDPAGEVAAAAPYPLGVRATARLVVGLAVVVPIYVVGAVVAQARFAPTPLTAQLAEAVGYGVAAVAIGSALRAWRDQHAPSYAASVALLGVALATFMLPRGWDMVGPQTWGPPWTAALLRWTALVLLGIGIIIAALRDPAAR